MRRIAALLAVLLFFRFAGTAQNRANFPWWNSPITQEIGLNQDQMQRIRQIVRSYRARLLDARNNVQKAEGDLDDLMNDAQITSDQTKPVIERVASARAASTRVFLDMSVQLRSVLTLDQWRQLVRRWSELQRKRGSETQVAP